MFPVTCLSSLSVHFCTTKTGDPCSPRTTDTEPTTKDANLKYEAENTTNDNQHAVSTSTTASNNNDQYSFYYLLQSERGHKIDMIPWWLQPSQKICQLFTMPNKDIEAPKKRRPVIDCAAVFINNHFASIPIVLFEIHQQDSFGGSQFPWNNI